MIKNIRFFLLLVVCLFLIANCGISEEGISEEDKLNVGVPHSGNDVVGKRVVIEAKKKLAFSQKYKVASKSEACDLLISVVSRSTSPDERYSALSVAYIIFPYSINYICSHELLFIDLYSVPTKVESIIAYLDKAWDKNKDFTKDLFIAYALYTKKD